MAWSPTLGETSIFYDFAYDVLYTGSFSVYYSEDLPEDSDTNSVHYPIDVDELSTSTNINMRNGS